MTQTNPPIQNLLVIDNQVTDWQSLAAGAGVDTAVLILDSGSDGLTQISDYFSNARRLSENANENLAARITPPPIFMAQP